jgi:hypothetical protein
MAALKREPCRLPALPRSIRSRLSPQASMGSVPMLLLSLRVYQLNRYSEKRGAFSDGRRTAME